MPSPTGCGVLSQQQVWWWCHDHFNVFLANNVVALVNVLLHLLGLSLGVNGGSPTSRLRNNLREWLLLWRVQWRHLFHIILVWCQVLTITPLTAPSSFWRRVLLFFAVYWWNCQSSVKYSLWHLLEKCSKSNLRSLTLLVMSTLLNCDCDCPAALSLTVPFENNLLPSIRSEGVKGSSISSSYT